MALLNSASKTRGFVDSFSDKKISGWVGGALPEINSDIFVDLYNNNLLLSRTLANLYRSDISNNEWRKGYLFEVNLSEVEILNLFLEGNLKLIFSSPVNTGKIEVWHPLIANKIINNLSEVGLNYIVNNLNSEYKNIFKNGGINCGRKSLDGVAAVGKNGELFLCGGSNDIKNFYSDEIIIDVESWHYLIKQRINFCKKIGVNFIQILIPEKTSVLYWKSPFKAARGSKSLEALAKKINSEEILANSFFNLIDCLNFPEDDEMLFRRYDTHFSTFGCQIFLKNFLEKFFCFSLDEVNPSNSRFIDFGSDLGGRFSDDGDVLEVLQIYDILRNKEGVVLNPEIIDCYNPEEGHMGMRRVWRCNNAPINKKIICFGNSFFERGNISSNLSWWFCRLFKEFHFIWDNNFDYDYLEKIKPDYVLGQTIERFLRVIPKN